MDTLHSPTVSSPSDGSCDSRDEPELDLMETMSSLTMSHNNGSGNGKYLLGAYFLVLLYVLFPFFIVLSVSPPPYT